MSPLTIRRLIVWIVSMLLGALITVAVLTFFLPWKNPSPNAEVVGLAKYGTVNFTVTTFAFGMIFVTILDHFMDTRIWPD
jgi:hypothetical protein